MTVWTIRLLETAEAEVDVGDLSALNDQVLRGQGGGLADTLGVASSGFILE